MSYGGGDPWVLLLLGGIWLAAEGRQWVAARVESLRERRDAAEQRDALEELQHRYATGPMPDAEFERRLEDLMDPCDEEMRRCLEDVEDVGDAVATEVAVWFESLEHVRQADRRELEEVPDVGEVRAKKILEYFD